ncbi:MAG: S49 family peptidase [Candidatus Sulfotelmatobacter sp.]|jgi:signal peptide peptidase SppA
MMTPPTENLKLLTRSPLWAILPGRLDLIVAGILNGQLMSADWQAAKPSTEYKGQHKIAIIPIQGVLSKDGPAWLGSNYDTIADAAEKAAADPAVKRVVLSVDSPGGEVLGLPETAAVLARVAKVKPVSAMIEGTAASAAYWLTSQANDISITPSAEVGSVGVRMMHADISKMLDNQGIKITELYSGKFKNEWSPFKPLSDDAVGDMQSRLAEAHNDFITGVANGRGNRASAEMKRSRFGEGRMFGADKAVSHGLVDKIQTGREFYRSIVPAEEAPKAPVHVGFGLQRARIDIERAKI